MRDESANRKKRHCSPRNLWQLVLMIIGVIVIIRELSKPAEERTWHGKMADLIPYDFRKPTVDRFRDSYWNPDGPLLPGKPWGVGWALNLGAIKRLVGG